MFGRKVNSTRGPNSFIENSKYHAVRFSSSTQMNHNLLPKTLRRRERHSKVTIV